MDLLHRCRDHAHKYYCDLLVVAEKTLNEALFKQAEQCANNQDQRRFFEAMQELKNRGGALHATFRQALESRFRAFESGKEEVQSLEEKIDMEKLSLVKRDELEDDIAISVIVSKSNSRNSEALWKLNRRLAAVRGGRPVTDETNPFGPAEVCEALQTAMSQLSLDSKAKIFIYKQLGSVFIISFAKELDALNNVLAEGGILRNLKFSVNKSTGDSSAAPEAGPTTPAAEKLTESSTAIADQQQLYQAIRQLQSRTGPRTHTAGGVEFGAIGINGQAGVDSFASKDYAQALTAIHQAEEFLSATALAQPLAIDAVEQRLLQQLTEVAAAGQQQQMTREDADTVDLVGMIFRYMLDDPNLHDSVKSLLSHLHTPYLKLALLDKTFLDNYQHSARLLLNNLADIGSRWVKEDNDRIVLPKLKTVVETILKGFTDDPGLFDDLLEDLSRYKDGLEKRARMVEKRNTEAQQGLEKLELARQQAEDQLELRFQKYKVTDEVSELLRQPWTDFIAFNLLRHGEESLTWKSALKVLDGVVLSVSQQGARDNREDFHRRQLELEKTVSEGLSTIGYDPQASKGLLSALKQAHELSFNKTEPAPPQVPGKTAGTTPAKPAAESQTASKEKPRPTKAPKTAKKQPEPLTPEEQKMVEKLKEIAFGTWFEFDREKSTAVLKLAWFSRVTRHYMFVDQAGVKQAVQTQVELARGMCANTIRIVTPTRKSFMERALNAVLEKLKLA